MKCVICHGEVIKFMDVKEVGKVLMYEEKG